MKTKKFWAILNLVAIVMGLSVAFSSCSKDKDEDPTLSVSTSSVSLSSNGGSTSFSITSNTNWSISGAQSWIYVTPTAGSGDQTISISAESNTSSSSRSCTLVISSKDAGSQVVVITQDAKSNGSTAANSVTVTNNSVYSLDRFRIVFLNSRLEKLADHDFGTFEPGNTVSYPIPTGTTEYYMATYISGTWFFSANYEIVYSTLTLSTAEIGGWSSNSSSPQKVSELQKVPE